MAEATKTVTRPEDLAKELEVSAKQLRAYLRQEFPRSAEDKGTSWELNAKQVKACRDHFASDEDED